MDNLPRRRVLKLKSGFLLLIAMSLPIVILRRHVQMIYTLTNHTQLEIDNTIESEHQLKTITEYVNEEDQKPAQKKSLLKAKAHNRSFKNNTLLKAKAHKRSFKNNTLLKAKAYDRLFEKIKEGKFDVSKMLDFAILGFPKCGTSTMRMYLNSSEIWVADREQCQMAFPQRQGVHQLVKYLYAHSPRNKDLKKGMKCPLGLEAIPHLANMNTYFKNTNIIVGIRHPVRWFESFYNFRVQNMNFDMPIAPVQECLKPQKKDNNSCYSLYPSRGNFHRHLSRLGKTSIEDDKRAFVTDRLPRRFPHDGKVFIYVLDQLGDVNETRNGAFREDLARFLGVTELPPTIGHKRTGMERTAEEQAMLDEMKIDICDDGYENVRDILMGYARGARRWITSYFINSEDVFVSSRDYFEQLLDEWEYDPCDGR